MVIFFSAAEKTVYCITVSKGILRTVKKAYKTLVKRACFFACLFCFFNLLTSYFIRKFALSINRYTCQRSGTKGDVRRSASMWHKMSSDVAQDGRRCGTR